MLAVSGGDRVNIKKALMTLDELYKYGETEPNDELTFLLEQKLAYAQNDRWLISRSLIRYTCLFQKAEDCIYSLFCIEPGYQDYLLKNLLITALQMRAAQNSRGVGELVNQLPALAGQAVDILSSIYDEASGEYQVARLVGEVADSRYTYREQDLLLFNGEPEYQRLLFYLDRVQQFKLLTEPQEMILGSTIDEMWSAGRKISTSYGMPVRKAKPEFVLAPFENNYSSRDTRLHNIIGQPWELFVLMLAIIREQYEVEKDPAMAMIEAGNEIQIMLTTRQGKELLYGSLDQFSAYLCRALDYDLFPGKVPPAEASLKQLYEKELIILKDGKYLLNQELEDQLYTTSLGITFITNSKKLASRIRKFIDELRVG